MFIILAFLCCLVLAPAVHAQDPPAADGGGGDDVDKGKSLWDLFKATGVVGILMVLLSVAGMAIAIDTAMAFSIAKLAPPELVAQVSELVDNNEFEEAAEVALASESYFGKVVGAGLVAADHGFETALTALDTTANEEGFKLNVKMSYLSLVGNIAPLLGLLGTVTGMISSFQVIETKKSPTPADLAVGVYESLVNTTMGLFIAIVFLTLFFLFKNKVTSLTLGVGTLGHELIKHASGEK
jgi:biopolymer transport protein ExbB